MGRKTIKKDGVPLTQSEKDKRYRQKKQQSRQIKDELLLSILGDKGTTRVYNLNGSYFEISLISKDL